ncbi:MAG: hypothetical protein CMF96_05355 [Candidatus Marinimicrobia bacterium]|nr:hypothetical protein [Candidatus Neomarinimicrobiota bacterium]
MIKVKNKRNGWHLSHFFYFYLKYYYIMIKVKNNRKGGCLFHYAHFICDCLFTEIINDIYKYELVIREKSLKQTIGNFDKFYNTIMRAKNRELLKTDFNNLNINMISCKDKKYYCNKINFEKFTNYIFSIYNIDKHRYNIVYPSVILVKRGKRKKLIDDNYLSKPVRNVTSGKERRKINNIFKLETYLQNKYSGKFKSMYFENLSFEEQVRNFNNAKLIICAHGAVMSNMFFCKENTFILEVTCGSDFEFFNKISEILNLNHIKCHKNNYRNIIKNIENIDLNL